MQLRNNIVSDEKIVSILTPMLQDKNSEINKEIINVIENNDNFKETVKNEVEKLDKKESYVYKKPDGTIYYGPEPPPEGE